LVDDDVPGDRRVERVLEAAPKPHWVLDIRVRGSESALGRARDLGRAAWLAACGLRGALQRRRQLGQVLEARHPPLAGLAACFCSTVRALAASRQLSEQLASRPGPLLIHANDLVAGLAVTLARPQGQARFVYDSHEFQIQRHRRAGWLRILIEHEFERKVIEAAHEVRTVNRAVAGAMQRVHPTLRKAPRVIANDVYAHHEVAAAPAEQRPALVHIGKGTRGRLLERLDLPPEQLGFEVHAWLLGSSLPPGLRGEHFALGAASYEGEVLALLTERRCLMWCGLDRSSLSYRLATPNKLFQALAFGMPIVASPDTYLAELVERHGIGVVDDGDLPTLARRVQSQAYEGWVASVTSLRARLRNEPELF